MLMTVSFRSMLYNAVSKVEGCDRKKKCNSKVTAKRNYVF